MSSLARITKARLSDKANFRAQVQFNYNGRLAYAILYGHMCDYDKSQAGLHRDAWGDYLLDHIKKMSAGMLRARQDYAASLDKFINDYVDPELQEQARQIVKAL